MCCCCCCSFENIRRSSSFCLFTSSCSSIKQRIQQSTQFPAAFSLTEDSCVGTVYVGCLFTLSLFISTCLLQPELFVACSWPVRSQVHTRSTGQIKCTLWWVCLLSACVCVFHFHHRSPSLSATVSSDFHYHDDVQHEDYDDDNDDDDSMRIGTHTHKQAVARGHARFPNQIISEKREAREARDRCSLSAGRIA